jgi:hypothetical protein
MAGFFIFRTIYSRMEKKPFSEETAERMANFALQVSFFLLLGFLMYHYFINEPSRTAEMLNNMTGLIPDNPSGGVLFNGS